MLYPVNIDEHDSDASEREGLAAADREQPLLEEHLRIPRAHLERRAHCELGAWSTRAEPFGVRVQTDLPCTSDDE